METRKTIKALLPSILLYLAVFIVFVLFLRVSTPGKRLNAWMNPIVASVCAAELRLLGVDAAAENSEIFTLTYKVTILDECNGLLAATLLISACLTVPVSWRQRLLGALMALAFVLVFNQLRLISIMVFGSHWPDWVHLYEAVIIRAVHWGLAIFFFSIWARRVLRKEYEDSALAIHSV